MIEYFHKPKTVQEALGLKRKLNDGAVFLAGGTWVNAKAYPGSPKHIISLKGLGLDKIELKDGKLIIGALCTLQNLIESDKVPSPLKAAASQISSRNIRNMATLGGHIARDDSHSDVIPMLIALDAKVELAAASSNRGSRSKVVTVTEQGGIYNDLLRDRWFVTGGLITRIVLPKLASDRVAACRNIRGSSNATSAVTAAVSMTIGAKGLLKPIIALGGVASNVMRLNSIEKRLDSKPLPPIDEIGKMVADEVSPASDILGSAKFKSYEAGVAVALAAHEALRQKGGRR